MKHQDRQIVKALLQHLTDKCLVNSEEFRAALKHFNITTTWQASTKGITKTTHLVDVFSPETIDAEPHGKRSVYENLEYADEFAKTMRGDRKQAPRVDQQDDEVNATSSLKRDIKFWSEESGLNLEQIKSKITRWSPFAFSFSEIAEAKDNIESVNYLDTFK